jgi:LDH2 family malate/lactate/ureidoglycolate dehydrogenase
MVASSGDDIAVSADELTALATRLLVAAGIPQSSALTVAGALVDADLEGQSSHGVMLLDMYLDRIRHGSVSNGTSGTIVSDKDGAVVLDAGHALGHLVGDQAMCIAVERARRFAVGVVAVRHGFHFGTARRFALQAAAAGCIGIVMCNTRPLMPAPGGAERLVGNSPIAIAIPTDGPVPLVLDMATSAVAIGMLLPSGGPKGFGLAFMIDLMCGLLSGGASGAAVQPLYGDPAVPYDSSQLFIAIDAAYFGDPAVMRKAAAAAAERIRAGKTAPGTARLFAPGEPEWRQRERSADEVRLTPAVADMLVRMAIELGVSAAPLASDGKRSEKDIRHAEA